MCLNLVQCVFYLPVLNKRSVLGLNKGLIDIISDDQGSQTNATSQI